jgi:UDP:flavonoid glycosyltransferase YjiC (YdhE family)
MGLGEKARAAIPGQARRPKRPYRIQNSNQRAVKLSILIPKMVEWLKSGRPWHPRPNKNRSNVRVSPADHMALKGDHRVQAAACIWHVYLRNESLG